MAHRVVRAVIVRLIGRLCLTSPRALASRRQFSCAWLYEEAVRLPAETRPDKSGVVVWGPLDTDGLMLTIDPARHKHRGQTRSSRRWSAR
jgi:hypothetical protein